VKYKTIGAFFFPPGPVLRVQLTTGLATATARTVYQPTSMKCEHSLPVSRMKQTSHLSVLHDDLTPATSHFGLQNLSESNSLHHKQAVKLMSVGNNQTTAPIRLLQPNLVFHFLSLQYSTPPQLSALELESIFHLSVQPLKLSELLKAQE